MPNLLAHFGAQGIITQPAVRRTDAIWVLTGCFVPDVGWIILRVVRVVPGVNLYDLRLYAIVQATLLFSLVLALGISALSRTPARTFAILALGAVLHLLLDASETKWANGVHLLAPFSWNLLNFELFWPESLVTHALTALGLGYTVWIAWSWRGATPFEVRPLLVTPARAGLAGAVLAVYLAAPLGLMRYPEAANNHFIATLRDRDERTGSYVEFDRAELLATESGQRLVTYAREELALVGTGLADSRRVSLRARFIDADSVVVFDAHRHSLWGRDLPSYLGLLILGAMWFGALRPRSGGGG